LLVRDVSEMSAIANPDAVACLPPDVSCLYIIGIFVVFLKIQREVESEKLN
jgi:hypothetical protein